MREYEESRLSEETFRFCPVCGRKTEKGFCRVDEYNLDNLTLDEKVDGFNVHFWLHCRGCCCVTVKGYTYSETKCDLCECVLKDSEEVLCASCLKKELDA